LGWRLDRGRCVRHAKLGLGVVESVEGRGEQAKVEVIFEDGSRCKLLAPNAPELRRALTDDFRPNA
jgi:hypothetical protein